MILIALGHTLRDLSVAFLVFAAVASLVGFAVFIGRCIHGAEETPSFESSPGPEAPDLDDWLADIEPPFDFKPCEHPRSEVRMDRGAV